MWTVEHSVEANVTREAIWRLWSDPDAWVTWNPDIERIEADGPFATGTGITMTPKGQAPVQLQITELREQELFVDEAQVGELVIRTTHRIDRLDGDRVRVVYRTEIDGPDVDRLGPIVGPAITDDFPQALAALVALAGQ